MHTSRPHSTLRVSSPASTGTDDALTKQDSISTENAVNENQSSWRKLKKRKSLKQRSQVPNSFYLSVVLVLAQSYASGIFTSPATTIGTVYGSFQYSLRNLFTCIPSIIDFWSENQDSRSMIECTIFLGLACAIVSSLEMLFVAPFKAGMWTGQRAKRHVIHRYMGLLFLIQYSLAWVEFTTNYEGYKHSYFPFAIALNGTVIPSIY
jgi:hypothetical protein